MKITKDVCESVVWLALLIISAVLVALTYYKFGLAIDKSNAVLASIILFMIIGDFERNRANNDMYKSAS